MISVIVAVHNQLAMNRLFYDRLQRYTDRAFELIVIDNASTDGSREFFRGVGATVIENSANYSYPVCQNQGLAVARYDFFALLNNDVIVAPSWDSHLLEAMELHRLDLVTACGMERLERKSLMRRYRRSWGVVRFLLAPFGHSRFALEAMPRLLYGDWERFCRQRFDRFGHQVMEGFVGSSVVMTRKALERLGPFDERVQASDFDLYFRSKIRSVERDDLKPMHICLGVFHHHYIRLTMRRRHLPFSDGSRLISIEEKWGEPLVKAMMKELGRIQSSFPG